MSGNLNHFKQLLIIKKQELESLTETSQQATQTVELDQSKVGRLSRMDALQVQAMSQATEARRIEELNRIQVALKKIEDEDYGYCDECGEEISIERLELNPAVALCISCASNAEK